MPDIDQVIAWAETSRERARRASERADDVSGRAREAIARAEALMQQHRGAKPPSDVADGE